MSTQNTFRTGAIKSSWTYYISYSCLIMYNFRFLSSFSCTSFCYHFAYYHIGCKLGSSFLPHCVCYCCDLLLPFFISKISYTQVKWIMSFLLLVLLIIKSPFSHLNLQLSHIIKMWLSFVSSVGYTLVLVNKETATLSDNFLEICFLCLFNLFINFLYLIFHLIYYHFQLVHFIRNEIDLTCMSGHSP